MNLGRRNNQSWRTLENWALTVLVDAHAIVACDDHGFMRDKADPDAWRRAREIAAYRPFPGTTSAESLQAIDEIMHSVGDTCPECDVEK